MSGTGQPPSQSDAPEATQQKVGGAWVGYLIFGLMLLFLIVLDTHFAYGREWQSFTGTTVFTLAFLVVLIDPERFGEGIEGVVDRYVAMTRATQRLVILTSSQG